MELLIVISLLFILFMISVPIYISLFIVSFIALTVYQDIPIIIIGQDMFNKLNSYTLLAVLFFIIAGNIMGRGKISEKLINFSKSLVGWLKGGLGITTISANGFFGAISGAATPTLVAIGSLLYPSLKEEGYSEKYSAGLITSCSMLGIIIPPSIPMIFYAMVSDVSVGKMFAAGFVPAFLIMIVFAIYTMVGSKKIGNVRYKFSLVEVFSSVKKGFFALMLPVIIFVGIFGGIFSPTEAGAVSVVYAIVIELFVFKELRLKEMGEIIVESSIVTASFLVIVAGASTFTEYLSMINIQQIILNFFGQFIHSKYMFILVLNLIFLIVGTFIDVLSAIVLLAPILIPITKSYGIDPIHFGIIMIMNLGVGYITPPLGLNIFVGSAITDKSVIFICKSVMPFFMLLLGVLLTVSLMPDLVMFIPNLFYK